MLVGIPPVRCSQALKGILFSPNAAIRLRFTKGCGPTMLVGIPPVRCCGGAVERGPISKWKTDRLWMGHKLLRLKPGVPAGGFRRESLCNAGRWLARLLYPHAAPTVRHRGSYGPTATESLRYGIAYADVMIATIPDPRHRSKIGGGSEIQLVTHICGNRNNSGGSQQRGCFNACCQHCG